MVPFEENPRQDKFSYARVKTLNGKGARREIRRGFESGHESATLFEVRELLTDSDGEPHLAAGAVLPAKCWLRARQKMPRTGAAQFKAAIGRSWSREGAGGHGTSLLNSLVTCNCYGKDRGDRLQVWPQTFRLDKPEDMPYLTVSYSTFSFDRRLVYV